MDGAYGMNEGTRETGTKNSAAKSEGNKTLGRSSSK